MRLSRVTGAGLAAILIASCGGGGSTSESGSPQPSNAPRIISLTPASVPPGSNDFTLTVNGANFRSDSVVLWNEGPRATTFVGASQVTASIPKADVATGDRITVKVGSASAGATEGMLLKVEFPKPTITSISKTSAQVNDPGFTLTVNGSNFFSGAHVQWDGIDRVTQFASSTQLTAQIPSGDLQVGGNHAIRVSNPQPSAGISDAASFFISAPIPTITSITPDTVIAASSSVQFTITGTNFISATNISFDGGPPHRASLGATPTQLTFTETIPAKLGTVTFTVSNDGGGSASKTITLIPSQSGIQSWPLHTPPGFGVGFPPVEGPHPAFLVTDDLKLNVFSYQIGDIVGNPLYIPAAQDPCVLGSSCSPFIQTYPDLKPFVTDQSYDPFAISADARYFLYVLTHRTMSGANVNYGPKFLFDTCKGATAGCAQASYSYTVPGDGSTEDYRTSGAGLDTQISASGRYVAFTLWQVFLRDMCLGGAPAGCVPTTMRISAPAQVQGFDADAGGVQMSRDARFIYFYRHAGSYQGNLSAYDTCIGAAVPCVPGETVVNIDDTGATTNEFRSYAISPDGRYITFTIGPYTQTKLVIRDTCLGATIPCTPTTIPVNMVTGSYAISARYSLSPGGKYIATETPQTFGNPTDTNGDPYGTSGYDVYVISTCLGATTPCTQSALRVSVDAQGIQVGGQRPRFTPDGTRIIYSQFQGWVITEPLTLP